MISQRERGELARFYTVTDPKKHPKGYTVYKVTARIISRKSPEDVQEITVWKRYSDFRKLHQNLWQLHKSLCSQSELFPPFAKAKVFGRFDDSVIETRRQCSEDLLQFSANIPALYSSQHIQDFFEGGDVHDGSELIGPAEPFSDFLADSLSNCSSEVHRDLSGADRLAFTPEYGGPSSESDLTSLVVDTDSLGELEDGMASGRTSPNQPPRGAPNSGGSRSPLPLPSLHARHSPPPPAPAPGSLTPKPGQEASRPGGRSLLFSGGLRRAAGASAKEAQPDYLDRAGEHIHQAVQKETQRDYRAAFSYYRSGVDLLLQGVQDEPSPTRREAVKKRTAEYLIRAELIANQHLRDDMGQGSTQTVVSVSGRGVSHCRGKPSPAEELRAYRVLGVIDKVLLVMDKRTQETFILKGLQKSSDCGRAKGSIMPSGVPNMVRLRKFVVAEDTVYLLLQYAEGGKLWSHIGKFLRCSSPDDSFDIPFIQKSHTAAVHSPQRAAPPAPDSASAGSGSGAGSATGSPPCPGSRPQRGGKHPLSLHLTSAVLPPGLSGGPGATSEKECTSGATTSEEECTNSYLTLCNEYEQDKVEPDELEEEEETKSGQEASSLSLDVPAGNATDATAPASPRSHSLLSSDSLSPPVSAQELLRFFAEPSGTDGRAGDGEGPEHGEVFSPLPSPAGPGLSLDRSKHTPMEFFRIDSKDSASELVCPDNNGGGGGGGGCDLLTSPKPPVPTHSDPDPYSKVTEGDCPEMAREVTGLGFEPWGPELSDDGGSNESVPVISFKEAVVEDEGHPPDLLVNLPAGGGAGGGTASEREAPEAPGAYRPGPDVLQLHGGPEGAPPGARQSDCASLPGSAQSVLSLAGGAAPSVLPPAAQPEPAMNTEFVRVRPDEGRVPITDGAEPSPGPDGPGGGDLDEGDISRLFAALDELTLAAAADARIPEEFVRCWAVEMVTALDALHQEGVVCRDLNPNNILVNHQGHIQLTYFCSWSDVEDSYDKEAMAKMYCAPEVGGISEETAACDWWSLGAILFELLTGKSLLQCHPAGISRHTTLSVPEALTEEAASLLEQLLQYNPVERLGSGGAGADDIKSHPFFAGVDWSR
ncbi:unnamed protein product [Lota lota]